MSGWQLSCLLTNLLVPHMFLCLVLVSNLHDMGCLPTRGRVAFQVSRWKQATHHLVQGGKQKGRETSSQHSLLGSDPPQPSSSTNLPTLLFLHHHILISHATPAWLKREGVCPLLRQGVDGRMKGKQKRMNIAVNKSTFCPVSVWVWHPTASDS